jgi:hypothetical protein
MSTRIFKVLSKEKQNEFYKLYGNLDGFEYGSLNERIVDEVTISYFDHWLDESEYHLLDKVDKIEHEKRRQRFHSFYKELSSAYSLYSYRTHGKKRNKIQFRSFTSKDAMDKYFENVDLKKSKSTYPKILIPECNAVIHEGYDYCAYLGFSARGDVSLLMSLLEKHCLYALDRN